jgi:hypothetical protein
MRAGILCFLRRVSAAQPDLRLRLDRLASGCQPQCAAGLGVLRLVDARNSAQLANQSEALIRVFFGHGINIQLKPVFRLFSDKFLHRNGLLGTHAESGQVPARCPFIL